jgi:RNA 2',3'-cyclic 3'-phosphodiesterase
MPRLFTGIEIPGEVGDRLSLLRGGLPRARWIDPENYHLTLRFVGDIDWPLAQEIADALSRVRRSGFSLRINALDAFGSRKPHTIIARLEPSTALSDLQAEHERLLQRIGLPPEGRKYIPHVTLARLRGASGHDIATYLSLRGGFLATPFTVDRFVLYSAKDAKGGGPYVIEEAYPLSPLSHPAVAS